MQFENNELKDKFKNLEKSTEANKESAKEELGEINSLAKEAMKKANYNEQYSRKNNIKIMGIAGERESTESLVIKVQSV